MTAGGDGRIREDFYFPANFEKKHQSVKRALSKIGETCIIGYIKPREEKEMKKFLEEFKEFISRGNVMDMAVGVIIGGAFSSIVTSLVDDIINPILGIFGGINFDQLSVKLAGDATLNYGKFITAVINFLIMALIIFIIVKTLNKAAEKFSAPKEEEAPTTKVCPFCKSEIPLEATRCPHCTSVLEEEK